MKPSSDFGVPRRNMDHGPRGPRLLRDGAAIDASLGRVDVGKGKGLCRGDWAALSLANRAFALQQTLNLARSEAIKRGTRVDLLPLDGGSGDWRKGWVVLIDKNANQKFDAGDQVIFQHGPVSGDMTIKSVFTDSSVPYLAYNGTGRSRTNTSSQSPQAGTVSFTLDTQVRRIKVNFLGRARSCNPVGDSTCTGSAESQ